MYTKGAKRSMSESDKSKTELQKTETSPERSSSQTNGESFTDIINTIADRIDPVIKIIITFAERSLKENESEARFRVNMAWIAVVVIFVIVGVAGALTYFGKIDGSTFGFLLGLIVGYMLTFIRDSIKKPSEE